MLSPFVASKCCIYEFGRYFFGRALSSQPAPYQVLVIKCTKTTYIRENMDDLTQQTVWNHFHFSIKTWLFHKTQMFEIKRLVEKLKFLLHFSSKPPRLHLSEIHSPSDDVGREPSWKGKNPSLDAEAYLYIQPFPAECRLHCTVVQTKIKKGIYN